MTYPKISIITPSYNQGQFIEQTILSVLKQHYPNYEHIIVDGGSTDNTIEILKKYGSKIRWSSEPDRGQSHALNKGLGMADADIVGWLNSDDIYLAGTLAYIATFLTKQPNIGMCYGGITIINADGEVVVDYRMVPYDYNLLLTHDSGYIPSAATFIRRSVLNAVGGWNESLHMAMDYELWLKIGSKFDVAFIPKKLAMFRIHETAKTQKSYHRTYREVLQVSLNFGGSKYSFFFWRYVLACMKLPFRRVKRTVEMIRGVSRYLPLK